MLIPMIPQLVQLLKREITGNSDRQSLEINVYDYTTRVTLDITGDGELSSRLVSIILHVITISRLRVSVWCS